MKLRCPADAERERGRRAIEISKPSRPSPHLPAQPISLSRPLIAGADHRKAGWLCRVTPINDHHVFEPPSSRPWRPPLQPPGPKASLRLGSVFSLSTPSIFIRGAAAPLLAEPHQRCLFADRETIQHRPSMGHHRASSIEQRSLAACGVWFDF